MRKMVMVLAAVAVCAVLAGCAKTQWIHPTKDINDFNRDQYDCQYEATKATSYYAPNSIAIFEQAQQKNQLFSMCMHNKGYSLVKVEEPGNTSSTQQSTGKSTSDEYGDTMTLEEQRAISEEIANERRKKF